MKQVTLALFLICILGGCAAEKQVLDFNSKYISDVDTSTRIANLPFQHSWVWKETDRSKYHAIFVSPVRTDTLDASAWESSASPLITSRDDYLNQAAQVAKYFRQRLVEELGSNPKNPFKVATGTGPGVAVISIGLTEIEFAHPAAQAAALASPVMGTGAALSAVTNPHAAFALRVTDGGTSKLLATAADRKFPPARIIDLNKLTIDSSLREICSNWAKEISDAAVEGKFSKVEDRGVVSVLPW